VKRVITAGHSTVAVQTDVVCGRKLDEIQNYGGDRRFKQPAVDMSHQ